MASRHGLFFKISKQQKIDSMRQKLKCIEFNFKIFPTHSRVSMSSCHLQNLCKSAKFYRNKVKHFRKFSKLSCFVGRWNCNLHPIMAMCIMPNDQSQAWNYPTTTPLLVLFVREGTLAEISRE